MLAPQETTELAGYAYDPADTRQRRALEFAQGAIRARSQAVFLAANEPPQAYELRTMLSARLRALRVHPDAHSAKVEQPLLGPELTSTLEGGHVQLYRRRTGKLFPHSFTPGLVVITGARGWYPDANLTRVGALLVAYYLGLPDPEASRFARLRAGEVSSQQPKLSSLPVPEAEALLTRYSAPAVAVSVA